MADDQSDLLLQSQSPVRRPPEKFIHLKFFWQDIVSGPSPTAVRVVPPASNVTFFGAVVMIDDPLTVCPELSSKLMGRAQGFYALASTTTDVKESALLVAMNLAFMEGKYKGSTLVILGRNAVFSDVKEMPVVGGSSLFRLARGYALATTHSLNAKTGDAVVEYNVFVTHY